jgi:DnaJ-class molecular chaperone
MEAQNFYFVLGVPHSESTSGIKHAFRELALRYHPDRAGFQGTRFFQEIVDAYRVLSDPAQRALYDRGLSHAGVDRIRRSPITLAVRVEPEPLVPEPVSVFHDFEVTRPSFEEVFTRILQNFTEPSVPKSQRLDPLRLQLILGPEEAAHGGYLTLGVPVFYPCKACRGSGEQDLYPCLECNESGMVEEEEPVRVFIPAMIRDGTVFEIPLRGLGIHNTYLELQVRVG